MSTKHFKLSPKDFWNLTMFEYLELYEAHFGDVEKEVMLKDELDELSAKYPD